MSVEEKRRELFEAWAITRRHPVNGLPFFVMKNDNGDYLDGTTTYAWEGFNAALDAVVIELPEKCDVEEWSESFITFHGEGYSKDLIIEAIESTGLGLKVKS